MSKIDELHKEYLRQRDELIAKTFMEEDTKAVLSREKRGLQGYDFTPVVIILSNEICRLRRSSQERRCNDS